MADRRAEEMLRSDLARARPGYGFIGEEGGTRLGDDKTHTWIVDPLDGTTNFLHGIPHFAISIGLQREGTLIAGVIYNPANEELYTAERGKGAFLNDQRLRVAGRRKLNECVIGCGLPHLGRGVLYAAPQSRDPDGQMDPGSAAQRWRAAQHPGNACGCRE